MAYEFYVKVKGSKQGDFKNETVREKHKGKIPGISFHYNVKSPRDAASGLASGKRTHQPVTFIKEWGASSPQFFKALTTNELLSILFEFVTTDNNGEEYIFYTIALTNAQVVDYKQFIERVPLGDTHEKKELEEISLVFQKIEVVHTDSKTTHQDTWQK